MHGLRVGKLDVIGVAQLHDTLPRSVILEAERSDSFGILGHNNRVELGLRPEDDIVRTGLNHEQNGSADQKEEPSKGSGDSHGGAECQNP